MSSRSDYKKKTTAQCHWCDYSYKCRKGHKCKFYKWWVKKVANKKKKENVNEQGIDYS